MKTSELIKVLQKKIERYGDTEVCVTWEGITRGLDPSAIYLTKQGELYIDADDNYYKHDFARDPDETEVL